MSAQPLVQAHITENIKARVIGQCEENPRMTGGFPSQRASDAENIAIYWRHDEVNRPEERVKSIMWYYEMNIAQFTIIYMKKQT